MPERVRVALIGAGRIGQRHAATLASAIPRAELAIIADVHGPSAEALAAKVRCERWTDDPGRGARRSDHRRHRHRLLDRQPRAADRRPPPKRASRSSARSRSPSIWRRPIARSTRSSGRECVCRWASSAASTRRIAKAKELIDAGALGRIEAIRDTMRDPVTRAPRLPGNLRRPLPGHDDPQLRLRALDDGPGGARSSSPWGAPSSRPCFRSWATSTPA